MVNRIENSIYKGSDTNLNPPGKLKLIKALKYLLEEKDFNSITTAEIARVADVNEALIYWHFQDKRGLLHYVLEEYLQDHRALIELELKQVTGSLEKLNKLIWLSFDIWTRNKIYAKILLIESRSFPGYFESKSYNIVQNYAAMVKDIIKEGIESNEIREDVPTSVLRNIILGAIEHNVLGVVLFDQNRNVNQCSYALFKIISDGIAWN